MTQIHDLPTDVFGEIFSYIEVPVVCRLYCNLPDGPSKEKVGIYLQTCVVNVTAEELIDGDLYQISFDTYARLPPCPIDVTTTVGLFSTTKWHLDQVEYALLSLTVENPFPRRMPIDLKGIHGNVVGLSIIGQIEVDARDIPVSVIKLFLEGCTLVNSEDSEDSEDLEDLEDPENFQRLIKLTHFTSSIAHTERLRLPPLVTHLVLSDSSPYDASPLTNLKYASGRAITNLPWTQLESASSSDLPNHRRLDGLRKLTVNSDKSFQNIDCLNLDDVTVIGTRDLTDIFTREQLGQLTSVKAPDMPLGYILDVFDQVKVLHMQLDQPFTDRFRLPPQCREVKLWLDHAVESIPPQLVVFSFEASQKQEPLDHYPCVNVNSTNLRQLLVTRAHKVAIMCHNLNKLVLDSIEKFIALEIRNVVELEVRHLEHVPLDFVPKLERLTMNNTYGNILIDDLHLKLVIIQNVHCDAIFIAADEVKIIGKLIQDCGEMEIRAKVVHIEDADVRGIDLVCQELRLTRSHPAPVPSLVEKLVVDDLGVALRQRNGGYNELKYIFINGTSLWNFFESGKVPALVRQFVIGVVKWYKYTLRWEDINNCEHLECWSENVTLEQLGLTQLPSSVYLPHSTQRFQPQLFRRREPEPRQ